METRTILQIALAAILLMVVGLGAFLVYELTREADKQVVEEVVVTQEAEEPVNPWSTADKGEAAISLVKRVQVEPPLFPETDEDGNLKEEQPKKTKTDDEEEEEKPTVGEVLEDDEFIKKILRVKGERVGWQSDWWGETKHGPSFYLVRYALEDADITVGPAWLVDLKTQKVVPKNLPARVAENPLKAMASEYYDKKNQIVSAIANHRFDGGMSLAGALLVYFERKKAAEGDTIEGWTIDHDRGNLFKAYFQWVEGGEPTYAEFEFDFDRKALKPVNLQAANIMRVGEDFDKQRVSIMPSSYDPEARPRNRWKGAARKSCRKRRNRDRCKALATILDQTEVIESLEWLLTARSTPEEFEECKAAHECSWRPAPGKDKYEITYVYNLGDDERNVTWEVDLKSEDIAPTDRVSSLAFSAIRPR